MTPREVAKYLKRGRLLEPESPLDPDCRIFFAIPVCRELAEFDETAASISALRGPAAEVVAVINHPVNASPETIEENLVLAERFRQGVYGKHFHLICAPGLSNGVGEARKLAMDAVIAAVFPEELENLILCSMDADTRLDPGYLEAVTRKFAGVPKCGALSIGVRHRPGETPEQEQAIRRYEAYMDRYVAKLADAGSPYAFHTIGSAIAVRGDAYVRAGGMRVRKAGEDFYFLQALAKTSGVAVLQEKLVHPSPRCSDRVPFGTGPAVAKLLNGEKLDEIPDAAFSLLKQLLTIAHDPARQPGLPTGFPPEVQPFFERENFTAEWTKILKNVPESNRTAAFDCWFDGLKTLRLLHCFSSLF